MWLILLQNNLNQYINTEECSRIYTMPVSTHFFFLSLFFFNHEYVNTLFQNLQKRQPISKTGKNHKA